MTTPITKERLIKIKEWRELYGAGSNVVLPAEEAEELARIALVAMGAEPVYQCEFCHHDASSELQWHWEDVNQDFYEQYDSERRGHRRVLYTAPPALAAMDAEPVADVVAWHKEGEERTCDKEIRL